MAERWAKLIEGDRLLAHPVFAIELLHNSVTPQAYAELRADLEAAFDWVWPDSETAEIAMRLQRRMATSAACGQRVKTADLLVAAIAAQKGLGVLHYDGDYELIREHGGEKLTTHWLAQRGTLEGDADRRGDARKAYRRALGERMIQLRDDEDLVVWPELIKWMDEQLRSRKLPVPRPPA